MIIREATKFDLPYFIQLIEELAAAEHIMRYNYEKLNHSHLNSIFSTMLAGKGAMLVVENEETKKLHGMAAGIISPHLYAPHILYMTQIVLWVDEGFRKIAGSKLMKAYEDKTNEYMEEKRIRYGVITASEPLFDMDFSKYGYTMDEKCWTRGE